MMPIRDHIDRAAQQSMRELRCNSTPVERVEIKRYGEFVVVTADGRVFTTQNGQWQEQERAELRRLGIV